MVTAPILAVDVDGCAVRNPSLKRPFRAAVLQAAADRDKGWKLEFWGGLVLPLVTRARTACAYAHEHARRLS